MRKILFLMICSVFLISGCGSSGGGTAFFETVEVTAYCETGSPLGSDIIVWRLSDPNGKFDDQCDGFEVFPDYAKVTIRSVVFPVIELEEASQVRVENVRIDYYPWSNTPYLAPQNLSLPYIVEPNGELTVSIEVMSLEQKDYFQNDPNHYTSLIIDDAFYKYDATLTFSVVEITSHRKLDVSTNITIRMHDYKCTGPEDDPICDDDCVH